MVRLVFGGQDHAPDGPRRGGMLLIGGIPEIFGKVLLTDGKADGWRFGVARERKRETNFGGGAVRPLALALEMHGIRDPDRHRAKAGRVRRGVFAFEDEQRESLLVLEKDSVEGAEQRREAIAPKLLRLGHGQQLEEEAPKLDQVVMRGPRMLVARGDSENEAAVELRRRLPIAHGMDDMVEAAGHRRHFTAENAVGCRNMFLIEATIGPSRSLSARLASHSGSVANLFHFVSRSARDSQASR